MVEGKVKEEKWILKKKQEKTKIFCVYIFAVLTNFFHFSIFSYFYEKELQIHVRFSYLGEKYLLTEINA